MRIFLSWSGPRSERVAIALQDWLPKVVQVVRPWMSSADIDAGTRWNDEVANALEGIHFGIVCLSPENLHAPWILFEAGALAKAVAQARIIPYLISVEPHEVKGPLAQFQAVRADREGTLKLITAINTAAGDSGLSATAIADVFAVWWPRLDQKLKDALSQPARTSPPPRSVEDMVAEILSIVRGFDRDPEEYPSFTLPSYTSGSMPGFTISSNVIREQRLQRGLTLDDLATLAHISTRTARRAEAGNPVSEVTAAKIARVLGLSFDQLMPKLRRSGETSSSDG